MKRDVIEKTQKFKDAIEKIQPQLKALDERLEAEGTGLGTCHIYWKEKKALLKMVGIDWKTPDECNPDIFFD